MSMLGACGESMGYAQAEMKRPERCKPDYETMIATARKKHAACQVLMNAVTMFTDGNITDGKLAELVGEVYLTQSALSKHIEYLLKEQEAWED